MYTRSAIVSWHRKWAKCQGCGTVTGKYHARGYCTACYNTLVKNGTLAKRKAQWAWDYLKCVRCGTTSRKHAGKGLCTACSEHLRRTPEDSAPKTVVKGSAVRCKKWGIVGFVANGPYYFYEQKVFDVTNQYGELIQGLPAHMLEVTG